MSAQGVVAYILRFLLVCRYLALYKGLVPKIMRLGPGENQTCPVK